MPDWEQIFIKDNENPRELASRSVNFGMALSGPGNYTNILASILAQKWQNLDDYNIYWKHTCNMYIKIKNQTLLKVYLISDQVNLHHRAHAWYRKVGDILRIRYATRMDFDMVPEWINFYNS